jgi:hypothetical protein
MLIVVFSQRKRGQLVCLAVVKLTGSGDLCTACVVFEFLMAGCCSDVTYLSDKATAHAYWDQGCCCRPRSFRKVSLGCYCPVLKFHGHVTEQFVSSSRARRTHCACRWCSACSPITFTRGPYSLKNRISFGSHFLLISLPFDQLQLVPSGGDTGPRRTSAGTQIFCHLRPGPMPRRKIALSPVS